jgi:F-type H+-transporting ATPase subunit a
MMKYGIVGFWIGQVPHVDISPALALIIKPMLFFIEIFGMLVKHSVLAIRLLANMFAGHTVVAVLMAFISGTAAYGAIWYPVMLGSVGFCICMYMLELLVALIQAYIISFLSAMFIGMAIHQH